MQPGDRHTTVRERWFRDGSVLVEAPQPGDLRLLWVRDPQQPALDALHDQLGAPAALLTATQARHSRARLGRHGQVRVLTLRTARYLDDVERVEFGELQVLLADHTAVLVERGACFELDAFVEGLTRRPEALANGADGVAREALAAVLDAYDPVLAGLANDIDEIEDDVFAGERDPVRRIYELIREVLRFQRATDPLDEIAAELLASASPHHTGQREAAALTSRAAHARERVANYRALLEHALNVNLALETKRLTEVSIAQTEQTKKISSWAAILFTPSLVAGVYGMNFRHMPELHWLLGYPFAIVLMVALMAALYGVFKARDWL